MNMDNYCECEFIMNDCITTTKQSTTKPCAYFLGYTVDVDPVCVLHKYGIQHESSQSNHAEPSAGAVPTNVQNQACIRNILKLKKIGYFWNFTDIV